MKKINEMKRNEMMNELKKLEIQFDSKLKNQELMNLLEDSILESFNQESRKLENSDNSSKEEKKNFLDSLNEEEMKNSNFESIHNQFKDSQEISFINSLEMKFNDLSLKDFMNEDRIKNFNDEFQFIMIHRESRKIYYLFLYDRKNNQEYFIMKNDSIMKNKIYLLKFSQFFEIDSIKISYIKNDRKNQSHEIIDRNSKEYQDKIKKYSMI